MAVTFDTGDHKVTRKDTYVVNPYGIVVDWKKNLSRGGMEPIVDDDLKELALDMMPRKGAGDTAEGTTGQLNPVIVRKLHDQRLELVGGFRRMRAAMWLVESGTCPDFQIKYNLVTMSDGEAALANLAENLHRSDLTTVQLAHAVRALHEDYGLSMADIATRMKKSQSWLKQILDVTTLPADIQASVEDGTTTVGAALELTKLDGKTQREVFNAEKSSNGKVTAAAVKEAQRKKQEETTGASNVKRTLKHLRAFLESKDGPAEDLLGRQFANLILNYLDGKKSEEALHKMWDKLFPASDESENENENEKMAS